MTTGTFYEYCSSLPIKLTVRRKEVLYILWSTKKPLKAYEILQLLLPTTPHATPPTVYRALLFFVMAGVVHKIESIQSYTLCCDPQKHLATEILMVCSSCSQVYETHDVLLCVLLADLSLKNSFHLNSDAIELKGLCFQCNNHGCRI